MSETLAFFKDLKDHIEENAVSKRILPEIINRLTYLCDVGLGYLTLNRQANTLSGGESQRIHLAISLGSALVGSIYILDEPSIGLHPKDTENLIKVLKQLQKAGNTLIIVEHEEEIMRALWTELLILDLKRGRLEEKSYLMERIRNLMKSKNSLTGDYLNKIKVIPVPTQRRVLKNKITIEGAKQYNLKNFNLDIPLNGLVCVTGVSGSGKSSLIEDILYPALRKKWE